jgi:hypothetical protein
MNEVTVKRPVGVLVTTFKTLVSKGDKANVEADALMQSAQERAEHKKKKAEEYYIAAGRTLLELKEHKPAGVDIDTFFKEKVGLSKSSCYNYIDYAEKPEKLKQHRQRALERKKNKAISKGRVPEPKKGSGISKEPRGKVVNFPVPAPIPVPDTPKGGHGLTSKMKAELDLESLIFALSETAEEALSAIPNVRNPGLFVEKAERGIQKWHEVADALKASVRKQAATA